MKLQSITTNFMVKNVAESVKYYTEILGFDFFMGVDFEREADMDKIHTDIEYAFAIIKSGENEIMFQSEKSLSSDLPFLGTGYHQSSVALYMKIEDIESYFDGIKGQVEILRELETTWYGMKEFYIRDNNGYVIGFAEMCR